MDETTEKGVKRQVIFGMVVTHGDGGGPNPRRRQHVAATAGGFWAGNAAGCCCSWRGKCSLLLPVVGRNTTACYYRLWGGALQPVAAGCGEKDRSWACVLLAVCKGEGT